MFPPLTSSNLTFSQVALLFHKNPLPLLLHMSSSQVRTFNNKNTLILLSLLLLFPKISHPHNLLPGGRPSVWPPHPPPLPRLAVHVVGRRHTLRCCRPAHHHCPHAQVPEEIFSLFDVNLSAVVHPGAQLGDQHHDLISQAHPLHVSSSPPAAPPRGAVRQALLLPPLDVLG